MNCSTDKTKLGCAGFRKDAIRIYLQGFDEEECFYNQNNAAGWARCANYQYNVGPILKENKVRFVGLYSSYSNTYQDYKNTSAKTSVSMKYVSDYIGKTSGTLDTAGNPFSYLATDSALSTKATEGIRSISKNMPIQITTEKADIDAHASKLVDKLVLNKTGATVHGRICTNISNTESPTGPLPGIKDLLPGTSVCYDVYPVQNQSIFPATTEPQVKKARIYVKGDGSVLNSGIAYFLIPPVIEGPNT